MKDRNSPAAAGRARRRLLGAASAPAVLAVAGVAAGLSVRAVDADEAIPEPLALATFEPLFQNTPFRRFLSLSDNLVLSGVAEVPGRAMVTVLNRATNETFVVSELPNAQGWKLIELRSDNDLKRVSARILAGGQEVTLRFDPRRLNPERGRSEAVPGRRTEALLVVEALLRRLDDESAARFEELTPESQEEFRKVFVEFLQAYPEAPDDERVSFVRDTLDDLRQAGNAAGDGEGGAPPEGGDPPGPADAAAPGAESPGAGNNQ